MAKNVDLSPPIYLLAIYTFSFEDFSHFYSPFILTFPSHSFSVVFYLILGIHEDIIFQAVVPEVMSDKTRYKLVLTIALNYYDI